MNSIAYLSSNERIPYEKNTIISKVFDRFRVSFNGEICIKELGLKITHISLPLNINEQSYCKNINLAKKKVKGRNVFLAPKIYRKLDYKYLNDFQKDLSAFGIVASSKLILRKNNKSIRESCIVIYDAADNINFDVIRFISKEAKYIVLLSENIDKVIDIAEYVAANYGVAPVVTSDFKYAIENADFIITSKDIDFDTKSNIWYLNNMYIPKQKENIIINDISFKVPWDIDEDIPSELLGAILCQMGEKDVEQSLRYNGIFIDKIKLNNETLVL